jgi:carboxylesterase
VATVLPGAEPYEHDGSTDIGVLLCHGFTGSPQSMKPWADALVAAGFSVRLPRLPGHGTRWQEMNSTGWPDWYGALEPELARLRERCASVFVFGLSMGGTLALRLAEQHGAEIAGLVLVNPSVTTLRKDAKFLPVLARVLPSVAGIASDIAAPGVSELGYSRTPVRAAASLSKLWRLVRADLGRVEQPLLLLRSAVDHVVEPVNAEIVLAGVSSSDVREIVLPDSYHVATLDHDKATIFAESIEFSRRVHQQRTAPTVPQEQP